ncbi:peroxiredoxin [Rufibacter quisquiliarum]|uniref:thioredoxin-dependent peroxiredoxin n=1 Tax=Rufibacter quisquiliarum TaxID=1549639 RepID=A0A839GID1_9BACT|nr:peroxiredoxin [Rufibacter quisquiliarum]MBA9076479.1 peroxiredoxin Q/BCP [Rufibacter quisquiliarum]
MLKEGEKAPDFELPDMTGKKVRLYEILKEKKVVLYFYPKDDTRGCTKEACTFRDMYEDFTGQGAEVVGISSDSADSHTRFASKHSLPFVLLADTDKHVRKLYKVPSTFGLIPGRVTYVIDQQGTVQYAFNSMIKPLEHVQNALAALKRI